MQHIKSLTAISSFIIEVGQSSFPAIFLGENHCWDANLDDSSYKFVDVESGGGWLIDEIVSKYKGRFLLCAESPDYKFEKDSSLVLLGRGREDCASSTLDDIKLFKSMWKYHDLKIALSDPHYVFQSYTIHEYVDTTDKFIFSMERWIEIYDYIFYNSNEDGWNKVVQWEEGLKLFKIMKHVQKTCLKIPKPIVDILKQWYEGIKHDGLLLLDSLVTGDDFNPTTIPMASGAMPSYRRKKWFIEKTTLLFMSFFRDLLLYIYFLKVFLIINILATYFGMGLCTETFFCCHEIFLRANKSF